MIHSVTWENFLPVKQLVGAHPKVFSRCWEVCKEKYLIIALNQDYGIVENIQYTGQILMDVNSFEAKCCKFVKLNEITASLEKESQGGHADF